MDDPFPRDPERQPFGPFFFLMLAVHVTALWVLFWWFRNHDSAPGSLAAESAVDPAPPAATTLPPEVEKKFFTVLDKHSTRLPMLPETGNAPEKTRAPSPVVLPDAARLARQRQAEADRQASEALREAELERLSAERERAELEKQEEEALQQALQERQRLQAEAEKQADAARAKAEEAARIRANEEKAKLAREKAARDRAQAEAETLARQKKAAEAEKLAREKKAEAARLAREKALADQETSAQAARAKPVQPGTAVEPAKPVARATPAAGPAGGGNAGTDSAGSSGTSSTGKKDLDWYDRNVLYPALYRNWIQPRGPEFSAGKFQVQVRISVKADGTVTEKRILRGSGNATVDGSVQDALRGFSQAGPLPRSFTGSSHSQIFTFVLE